MLTLGMRAVACFRGSSSCRALRSWAVFASGRLAALELLAEAMLAMRSVARRRAMNRWLASATVGCRLLQITLSAAASLRLGALTRALRRWAGATGQALLVGPVLPQGQRAVLAPMSRAYNAWAVRSRGADLRRRTARQRAAAALGAWAGVAVLRRCASAMHARARLRGLRDAHAQWRESGGGLAARFAVERSGYALGRAAQLSRGLRSLGRWRLARCLWHRALHHRVAAGLGAWAAYVRLRRLLAYVPLLPQLAAAEAVRRALLAWGEVAQQWRLQHSVAVTQWRRSAKSRGLRAWWDAGKRHRIVRCAVARRPPSVCRRAVDCWREVVTRRDSAARAADEYALQCALGRLQVCRDGFFPPHF